MPEGANGELKEVLGVNHEKQTTTQQVGVSKVQVIGFGISGLGVAFAADRQGHLEALCQQGLVYLDKRGSDQLESLRFDILSNSPVEDFIAGISKQGVFADILNNENGRRLCEFAHKEVPLKLISEFFNDTSLHLREILSTYDASNFYSGTHVASLKLESTGEVTSFNALGQPLVTSEYAVIATGATERKDESFKRLAITMGAHLECSEKVLRGQYNDQLRALIDSGQKIIIFGGSHSAFSVVEYLLRNFSNALAKQQIKVITRSSVKLHYSCIREFNDCSQLGEKGLVDIETRRINRYCGLRSEAKKTYLSVIDGTEPRVEIATFSSVHSIMDSISKKGSIFSKTGLIIQATGYRAAQPKILNADGIEVECDQSRGFLTVSQDYRVRDQHKKPLKAIFAIGMGNFVAPEESLMSTGEIPVGVNVYHNNDAMVVLKNIMDNIEINAQTLLSEQPTSSRARSQPKTRAV